MIEERMKNSGAAETEAAKEIERMTAHLRSQISTAPDELRERTVLAMRQREQEKEQRKHARQSFAIRAAVIAAVITLMIVVTPPMRGYVVSAAESTWNDIVSWVHEWVDLNGTNPLFDDTHDGFHPDIAELGNASIITEEIHSDVIDLSDFNFTDYPKSIDVPITAEDFQFTIGEMQLADYEIIDNYFDVSFANCQNKGLIKWVYTDDWENYKGGTCQFPDVYRSDISNASTVELVFLKNREKLFKIKYNVSNRVDWVTDISVGNLYFGELSWVQPKYETLFDGGYEYEDVPALNDILLQLKPDQIEIASVSMIVEEQTDWILTDSPDKAENLKNEGYICEEYYDEEENLRFEAHKLKAKIIKGYNPDYYDLQSEAEKNKAILEEFNAYIDE